MIAHRKLNNDNILMKEAYKIVIKDLKKNGRCKEKDYCWACMECEAGRTAAFLEHIVSLGIE